jgi:hypothetical protein
VAFEGLCVAGQTQGILRPLLFCSNSQFAKSPCSRRSSASLLRDVVPMFGVAVTPPYRARSSLFITDGIDTKARAGRFFFHVMAILARLERELILERTRAGLEAARCAGRVGGRKRRMTDGKVQAARKLLASGTRPSEVAHSLGVSVPTLYRWVPASSRI